jgi:hypothetical protein
VSMKIVLPLLVFAFIALTGCSKNSDPAAAPVSVPASASYNLDGRATVGKGSVTYYAASANTAGKDALVITILSNPSGSATEDVVIYYYKPAGADNSQYKFDRFLLDGPAAGNYAVKASGTISQTATSNWSGTFEGSSGGVSIKHVLKDGVFTELK